jgi:prevent-host-death family protein
MGQTRVKPITYLKNRAAELVSHVADSGETTIITQNGEARAAVMGIDTYDSWQKALLLLKLAAHAEADVEAGRTLSEADAFDAAESAIRRIEDDA